MGAFDLDPRNQDEVKVIAEQQKVKHYGTMRINKGHLVFECNPYTGECQQVQYISKGAQLQTDGSAVIRKSVFAKQGYYYIAALNKKNALRKLNKMLINEKDQN